MSVLYTYICTKTTNDVAVPPIAFGSQERFNRDVSDGFFALAGGYSTVGKLAFFSKQATVTNHLLCNGSEYPKASFPELAAFLGDNEGAASSSLNFKVPNFVASLVPTPTATPEVVAGGTVSSGGTVTNPTGSGQTGGTTGGGSPSGGRNPDVREV